MERERRNNGDCYYMVDRPSSSSLLIMESSSSNFFPISPSVPPPSASSSYSGRGGDGSSVSGVAVAGVGGVGYIDHPVSKFDTLAGVAIKYGVEVADIKRMNGLVTDLQMFALKSLHIPLPGRHPPSPILANGIDTQGLEQTPAVRRHSDLFDSLQSLKLKSSPQRRVSPAMSSLQGYYGLKQKDRNALGEGCEMAVYHKGGAHYLEDGPFGKPSPLSNPPLGLHRKSKSLANGLSENGDVDNTVSVARGIEGESDNWIDKLIRRRQKSEADFTKRTPEKLLKEDNSSSGGFSAVAGKGLALRPKAAASRSTADPDAGWPSPIPMGLVDSSTDNYSGVRKSSSTPSFQDQDKDSSSTSSSSIWPTTKWSLKSDLQALSTAAIAMPIFDGLPKPMTGRRNKAALD